MNGKVTGAVDNPCLVHLFRSPRQILPPSCLLRNPRNSHHLSSFSAQKVCRLYRRACATIDQRHWVLGVVITPSWKTSSVIV